MDEQKEIIAKNLVRFRTEANLTQLQLAEMLNYSDKAVSKWERGESVPDVFVLMQIASIYNITLDDIVRPPEEKKVKPKLNRGKKRLLITLLSVGLVWFVATGVFAILFFIPATAPYAYLAFLVAPFASAVVLLVFSAMWGTRFTTALACSAVLWSVVVAVDAIVSAFMLTEKIWIFYVVAAPFQILIALWFVFRKVK